VCVVASLVASSLAFAAAFYFASDWNWAPAQLPVPGPGLAVEVPFEITTPGKFHIEARVPVRTRDIAIEDLPMVSCRLDISIELDDSSTRQTFVITEFRAGGRGALDEYYARPEVTLKRGSYVLTVRNAASLSPFASTGGMLTFTRFMHPTEFYLQGVLLRGIGFGGLLLGISLGLYAFRTKAA